MLDEVNPNLPTSQIAYMSFRALRIVPDNADIMQFAKRGSLDDVRSLFNKGLAAPTDVNDSWRVPVLSVSRIGIYILYWKLRKISTPFRGYIWTFAGS